MLLNNFYKYNITEHRNSKISAVIKINNKHKIFNGHFPEQPIVPGVSQVLMIKEIISDYLGINIQLESSKDIKFLAMINPNEIDNIQVSISYKIEDEKYSINARLHNQEKNFLKLRGVYCERK